MKFLVVALFVGAGYALPQARQADDLGACLQGSNLESKFMDAESTCSMASGRYLFDKKKISNRNGGICAYIESMTASGRNAVSDCQAAEDALCAGNPGPICDIINNMYAAGRQDNGNECVAYFNSLMPASGRNGGVCGSLIAAGRSLIDKSSNRNGGICAYIESMTASGRNAVSDCQAAEDALCAGNPGPICDIINNMYAAGRQDNGNECVAYFNSLMPASGRNGGICNAGSIMTAAGRNGGLCDMYAAGRDNNGLTCQEFFNSLQAAGRNADECPSFKEITDYIMDEYSEDSCYLTSFGWFDANTLTYNNEVIKEDLMTLPAEVTASISEDSVAQCVEEFLADYADHDCANNYTAEEQAHLMALGTAVAQYECLREQLEDGCEAYLSGTSYNG